MRNLIILAVLLTTCSAFGGDVDVKFLQVTSGTTAAAAVTNSISTIRGKILEVYVDLATATNVDVTVSIDPQLTTMSDITLYTADDVDADVILRPGFDRTAADGTALTDTSPVPFVCIGDAVKLVCENFDNSNLVVNAVIKYEKK